MDTDRWLGGWESLFIFICVVGGQRSVSVDQTVPLHALKQRAGSFRLENWRGHL